MAAASSEKQNQKKLKSKNESKTTRWISLFCEFLLSKFPLFNALTLLMLLAERSANESFPPIKPMIIYINLAVSLICGLMMSLKYQYKPVLLVYAGQLLYFAYTFYTNPKLKYSEWHRIQISTRHVGCAGIYILYSSFLDKKSVTSRQQLQRIGEILLGIYFFAYMYALNNSAQYKEAFLSHVPGGDWSRFIVTVIMATCSLGFITGFFVRDICLCSSVILMFMVVVLDGDFTYWTKRGVHYWNVVRMTLDSMCCVVGFIYFSVRLENKIKME